LHLSAIDGYSDIAGILTDNKVNVIETDKNDLTPLDYAVYHGNRSTAALLEEHGAMPASALVFDNLLDEKLNEAEAIIYYLNYSSWAIKTRNHLLIIDYFPQNKVPDDPSVLNGRINPSELADKNVTVFSTHEHGDHYNEVIWEWEKEIKDIRYILGFNAPQSAENRFFIEPHKAQEVNGITVTPVISNDAGQGFMIETDGITLVHPGDLASSTRDISADYRTEIEYLANLNKHVDFLFLPVRGCSFPDVEAVILGDLYAIGKLKPRVVFPMHGDAESFSEFKERVTKQYKNQQVEAVKYRGDRYIYKKEKIQKAGL
jgi:L-ascorbate metabolism protein UlaG (beta-lactamase superfamily)